MLLKSWAMPPVSWPTASIFWTWRSWASAASRSGLGLERLIGLPQFLCALAHRLLEHFGSLGLIFDLAHGGGILAERLDGNDAEENGADPDQDSEPAQVIGQLVGLGGEDLALLDAARLRLALRADDLLELVVERLARPGLGRSVEIADAGVALLGQSGPSSECEFIAVPFVKPLRFEHPPELVGIVALQRLQLADLESGELPCARIDVAAALHVFIERETGERRVGARDVRADVSNDQCDLVGLPLRSERVLARVVGELDHEHHDDEDERRDEARGGGTTSPPVEPDGLPIVDHPVSVVPGGVA